MPADLDEFGRSDLHYASAEGDASRVRQLLARGLSADLADVNGWTPLHFAAQARSVAVAVLLLDAGAPVDATEEHGNTPLFTAVCNSRGEGELIELLRANGADAFHSNHHDQTPVGLARLISNYDIARHFADLQAQGSAPAT
jgi:ankyrin repeat protein